MNLKNVDKNFINNFTANENELDFYSIPNSKFDLYGVFYSEEEGCFMRIPQEIANNVSEGVAILNKIPSGGRIRFSTNAKKIRLIVTWKERTNNVSMTSIGSSGFTLFEDFEDGSTKYVFPFSTFAANENGYSDGFLLNGDKMRNYTIYFPYYNDIVSITIGLEKGAEVKSGLKYKAFLPILYYGSSITQGCYSSRPDLTYQNIISKQNNVDYINLGFAGNCKGEKAICDYLATIPCSIFVCDYDHNAPTVEHLKNTHYNVYETFRKAQPDTPIIFITRPGYKKYGNEANEMVKIVKKTYNTAIKNGDKNVYFIDGRTFFNSKIYDSCLMEGCHPLDIGFQLMAKKIGKMINKILNIQLDK